VLAARIDRLLLEDKPLLQSAAVIGKDVPYPLLLAVADLPEGELREGLARLQAAEFLYETSLFPELEYTFKHALTHEVAYSSQLQERRRALHASIVAAIEWLYAGREAKQIELLAHHAYRGEVWEKAVTYLHQAGAKAASHSAYRQAVARLEQALVALSHVSESRETLGQAIELRFDLRGSLLPLGGFQRMLEHLHESESLAETQDDQRLLGRISALMTQCYWQLRHHERAAQRGERALRIATETGDFVLQLTADRFLGFAYQALGDYPRALHLLRRNAAALDGERRRE
jgi:predicted ATPase